MAKKTKTVKKPVMPQTLYAIKDVYVSSGMAVYKSDADLAADTELMPGDTVGVYQLISTGTFKFVPKIAKKKVKK